jgi:hypothetical protein
MRGEPLDLVARQTNVSIAKLTAHDVLPPLRLHSLRNFFRSFPCSPFASACSEQALEIAALSAPVGFAATAGLAAGAVVAGVCPKLIPIPAVAARAEKATTRSNLMTASNPALAIPM